MSTLPELRVELTKHEQDVARAAALGWSGGRGDTEDTLYRPIARLIEDRLRNVLPCFICATCGTSWSGDVRQCPTCQDAAS